MNRVTLIQCTNSKRDHEAQAMHLYDPSDYFCKMRAWARDRGNPWYILSAKHGLLEPERIIDPYDNVGISEAQAANIGRDLERLGVDVVDVTAGRKYTNPLVPVLEKRGIDVVNHFAGERIGTRMRHLDEAVSEE